MNIDPPFVIALVAALLGGASIVLHVIAPRTRNTVDDRLRDDIDRVLEFIRGTPSSVVRSSPPPPPRGPQSGRIAVVVAFALAMTTSAGVIALDACTHAQRAAAKTAVIDCVSADAAAIGAVVAELGTAATLAALDRGAIDWEAIESASWAQGKVVGGCALVSFVGALGKAPAPQPEVASLLPPPDPAADGRAALV